MRNALLVVLLFVACIGCHSEREDKVAEVTQWTLIELNGCWSLSSTEMCCSKMIKTCDSSSGGVECFFENVGCVSIPSNFDKISGSSFYRIELTDRSGGKQFYWSKMNQVAVK